MVQNPRISFHNGLGQQEGNTLTIPKMIWIRAIDPTHPQSQIENATAYPARSAGDSPDPDGKAWLGFRTTSSNTDLSPHTHQSASINFR